MRPIVVAGAGPVGLALALGLARRGATVEVLEAEPQLSNEARASTFHPPTLEMLAAWGVIDEVLALGRRVDELQFWERERRACVARFDYALLRNDTPYPFRFQCPQDQVTRVLLRALEASGRARVRFSHRVTGLVDAGDHVRVTAQTPLGPLCLEASWLCGTDGARSAVRQLLGLAFSGMTYVDRFLLVATDLDLDPVFPGIGPVAYVFDPEEWVVLMRQPRLQRLVFRLRADEDDVAAVVPQAIRTRILRLLGQSLTYRIEATSVYRVHQRVADRFRVGRVLLAGDAAHVNNPTGGMGMNSGIHDAWLLAERLSAALDGVPEATLEGQLDAWADARRAAALAAVQHDADSNYRALSLQDRAAREQRNRELAAAASDPMRARQYLLRASMLLHAPRPATTA